RCSPGTPDLAIAAIARSRSRLAERGRTGRGVRSGHLDLLDRVVLTDPIGDRLEIAGQVGDRLLPGQESVPDRQLLLVQPVEVDELDGEDVLPCGLQQGDLCGQRGRAEAVL